MIEVMRACSRSGRRVEQNGFAPVRHQQEALEEDIAARVVAGEVIVALRREQQHGGEPALGHRPARGVDARLVLVSLEM